MKITIGTIYLLLTLLALSGTTSAGELYTWTDGKGIRHISDRPPADNSRIEHVIRYASATTELEPANPKPRPTIAETTKKSRLRKRLTRLEERRGELEAIVAQNRDTIAAAEADAAVYRRRSGAYARRNVSIYERQLVVLRNNLAIYESDLHYVKADIRETWQMLKAIESPRP